jgi:6-pyruvoyl-tetrahydropterin synthase
MLTVVTNFKEPTKSTIALNNISVVDHAYIDDVGRIRGGSFNPNFVISGTPDPIEKVVVDFSTIKKDVKKSIDAHISNMYTNGFDHKVWIIKGFSKLVSVDVTEQDTVCITTPVMKLTVPYNAVRVISEIEGRIPAHSLSYIGTAFAQHVYNDLVKIYPDINLDVQCVNTVDEHVAFPTKTRPFHYVHGLKDSTSYGCQNIAHGHRSFIQLDVDDHLTYYNLMTVASQLDDTIFVRQDNVLEQLDDSITIGYATDQRGTFTMMLDTNVHKVVVLPTETTVEFLAAYIKGVFGSKFVCVNRQGDPTATKMFVSEGLSKGSLETL